MVRPSHIRRLLQGRRGIVESYRAEWDGRGFPREKIRVRVDRYRDRAAIDASVFEMDDESHWRPAQTKAGLLTPEEWEQFSSRVELGFWRLPERDAARRGMDGESWYFEGYRRGIPPSLEFLRGGTYHSLMRHTWSIDAGTGAETFALGMWMATLAGLRRFEECLPRFEELRHRARAETVISPLSVP